MYTKYLLNKNLGLTNLFKTIKYKMQFKKENPDFFEPEGLICFTGSQGTGKTLTAVEYIKKLTFEYPKAIVVTNTAIMGLNPKTLVYDYDGINCLTDITNGFDGVIYYIDEIHLEFNSLESSAIPIEIFIEISQQRKQRKHIIGTSQRYNRMAKALREQINLIVICQCYFGLLQFNKLANGDEIETKDDKLQVPIKKRYIWFHSPDMYNSYDTYAKMKRYNKEFKKGFITNKGVLNNE